jgi:hypothetical protein
LLFIVRSKIARLLIALIIMPSPTKRQINYLTRSCNPVKSFKGFKNNCPLLLNVARFTKRMTERPFQVNAAWRLNLFRILPNNGDANGGDTGFFNLSLYQSHGLIADASSRGEEDHVNLVLFEPLHHLLSGLANQGRNMSTVNMSHEGVVDFGQLTNDAFLL